MKMIKHESAHNTIVVKYYSFLTSLELQHKIAQNVKKLIFLNSLNDYLRYVISLVKLCPFFFCFRIGYITLHKEI